MRLSCFDSDSARIWFQDGLSALLLLLYSLGAVAGGNLGNVGTYTKWSRIEIELAGADSLGMGNPNPFLVEVDVNFSGPGGQAFTIPGFYDGDGAGSLDGNIWKVRFSANVTGTWSFISTSADPALEGYTGTFEVVATSGCQPAEPGGLHDFTCDGRLEYVGEHYLKFADGSYWLKGGVNDPEDFLAANQSGGLANDQAAVDYLSSNGVNEMYIMLQNVGGDHHNVWPWVGSTETQAKANHERFDVARLAAWETLFNHIQQQGLVLQLVFEDDSGWTAFNRSLFYREMIARFGHHNGLIWNLCEEFNENYSSSAIKGFAQTFSDLDGYGHPLTTLSRTNYWLNLLGDDRFDITSFHSASFPAQPENTEATTWFQLVEDSGRTIPASWDESTRGLSGSDRGQFRHIIWAAYMGGANLAIVTQHNPNLPDYGLSFEDLRRARAFVEGLPFPEMQPYNNLVINGQAYVFAKPGEVYTAYLPDGGEIRLDLTTSSEQFDAVWFDPRDGSLQTIGQVQGGIIASFTAPDSNDWTLLLTRDETASVPAQITSTAVTTATAGQPYIYYVEAEGVPVPTYALLDAPAGMSIDPSTGLINWIPATPGSVYVKVEAVNTAGSDSQEFTIVVEDMPPVSQLLFDDFNRPDSSTVGSGWIEYEVAGAAIGIQDNRLCVLDSTDNTNRPLMHRTFQPVSSGEMLWAFDFDWTRVGSEGTYRVFMQLGEGNLMSNDDQNSGVGVNLVWSQVNGIHEILAYRTGGSDTALAIVSGSAHISVRADLDSHTYEVSVDGAMLQTQVPFDNSVGLDTVRFFTDGLRASNFAERCFDNVKVESALQPDGDINDDGLVDIKDMLLAMRILLGTYIPTSSQQARWDVAPLVGGVPQPDGQNDLGDYVVLQRKLLGIVNF